MRNFRSFFFFFFLLLLALGVGLFIFILYMNPYNNVSFMPPAQQLMGEEERFNMPSLARDQRFDSAIFGSSTLRLLKPDFLRHALGGSFVNLTLPGGVGPEVLSLLDLFLQHHPAPKALIIGIDPGLGWCTFEDENYAQPEHEFPSWMYDANPWNDFLYLFNAQALSASVDQIRSALDGKRRYKHDMAGYDDRFIQPDDQYTIARFDLGMKFFTPKMVPQSQGDVYGAPHQWSFPLMAQLQGLLHGLPDSTTTIFVLPPYYVDALPQSGTLAKAQFDECLKRMAGMGLGRTHHHVVNFMIPSQITRDKYHFWDPWHITLGKTDEMMQYLGYAVLTRQSYPNVYDYIR